MSDIHNIWTNNIHSNKIKAFKSALSFRRGEEWHWTDNLDDSELWVIDTNDGQLRIGQNVYVTYLRRLVKPRVAIITGSDEQKRLRVPKGWHFISTPIRVAEIFQWLDRGEPQRGRNRQRNDWSDKKFRLTTWPNVARYGAKPNVTITCANLLRNYLHFEEALHWGISPTMLERILRDAQNDGILQVRHAEKDRVRMSKAVAEPVEEEKSSSLIQRLIKRFM